MKKKKSFLLVAVVAIICIFTFISMGFAQNKSESTKDASFTPVIDCYESDEEIQALLQSNSGLRALKDFNLFLENDLQDYEIYDQYLMSAAFSSLDDQFFVETNRGYDKNRTAVVDGDTRYYSSLKTIEVNQRAFNEYFNDIAKGSGFERDDFTYQFGQKVPVVLGSNYQGIYQIGDEFQLDYLSQDITFYVKGFFTEGLNLQIGDKIEDLNFYICLPYFQIQEKEELSEEERSFIFFHYLEKNSAYIKSETPDADLTSLQKRIEEKGNELGLKYTATELSYRIDVKRSEA